MANPIPWRTSRWSKLRVKSASKLLTKEFCCANRKGMAPNVAVNQAAVAVQTALSLVTLSCFHGSRRFPAFLPRSKQIGSSNCENLLAFFNFERCMFIWAHNHHENSAEGLCPSRPVFPSFLYCVSVEPFLFWVEGLPAALKKFTNQDRTGAAKNAKSLCNGVAEYGYHFGLLLLFKCVFDRF